MIISGEKTRNWRNLKTWRPYFIIFALGFLLYSQTLFFDLTYLDDNTLILDRQNVLADYKNIATIFSTDAFFSGTNFYYRPLLNLSFMIDAQFGGHHYFVYHLDNIILHIISVILVFVLLSEILTKKSLAFFLSLFFLVHPALTQAVAWLPGRNDSLVAIFILAAVLSLISFSKRPRLLSLLAYTSFFFLALLTKETAILFPLLVLAYFLSIGRRDQTQNTDRILIFVFSFLAGFIWLIMRSLAFSKENVGILSAAWSIINNLPNALVMGGKMILPFNLSVLPVSADSTLIYGIVALALLTIVLFFSRRKRYDYLFFGTVWFLVFFLPPFAISNSAPYLLEHRLYLPLIGFLIILAEIDWIKEANWQNRKVLLAGTMLLIFFSILTLVQSRNFYDPMTFWQAAVKTSPHSPLAQKNLGVMYYFSGDYIQAINHDALALGLNPQEPMVHNNLGVIYMDQKKYREADKEFKSELEVNPGYDKTLDNLQTLYYRQKPLR
ncbi:MAG: hypothetical protein WC249_02900 [Patescibacteria group bacterium]|jgi:hypothetical protein